MLLGETLNSQFIAFLRRLCDSDKLLLMLNIANCDIFAGAVEVSCAVI